MEGNTQRDPRATSASKKGPPAVGGCWEQVVKAQNDTECSIVPVSSFMNDRQKVP